MSSFFIDINNVKNLGRIPVSISKNPLAIVTKMLDDNSITYKEAEQYLFNYYDNLSYSTLNDLYMTDIKSLSRYAYDIPFLPWLHIGPVVKFTDHSFITNISKEKIEEKVLKIYKITKSIKKKGFVPDKFPDRKTGNITGYFLQNNNSRSFYVVSGNHRVAILSALGFKKIPVIFERDEFLKPRDKSAMGRPSLLETYNSSNAKDWPGVYSKFLSSNEAIQIMNSFLSG